MIYFFSFIFGIVFGSFISVLVWRLKNQEKGIFLGRSKCPNCKHTLQANDLVPIFSYLFLKGKCRYCLNKISIIYPILELISGFFFVFITYFVIKYFGYEFIISHFYYLLYAWLIGIFILAIAFYDILFFEISFILSAILAVLVLLPQFLGIMGDFKIALILGIVGFLVFMLIIYLREKIRKIEGMGGGDAIGAALIGFMFPIILQMMYLKVPTVFGVGVVVGFSFYIALFLGFVLAGIVGIFFILIGKGSLFKIPFLPFLFLGLVLFVFIGEYLLPVLLTY